MPEVRCLHAALPRHSARCSLGLIARLQALASELLSALSTKMDAAATLGPRAHTEVHHEDCAATLSGTHTSHTGWTSKEDCPMPTAACRSRP